MGNEKAAAIEIQRRGHVVTRLIPEIGQMEEREMEGRQSGEYQKQEADPSAA